jgi:hypothetical protein
MKVVPRAKISLKPLSKFRGPLLTTDLVTPEVIPFKIQGNIPSKISSRESEVVNFA